MLGTRYLKINEVLRVKFKLNFDVSRENCRYERNKKLKTVYLHNFDNI